MSRSSLPIEPLLPELVATLASHPAVVLEAPPGAGKSTRVPLALLEADWLKGRSILMLEPRRLAATSVARFMARQLGEEVGARVGYAIRFERRISRTTRIEVVTEGILTRRLQSDPELNGVGLVIFDEFHERNLNSDLALALSRDVQLGLRDDLKILVMSATLDAAPVAALLGDAPSLRSAGQSYPVDVVYHPPAPRQRLEESVAAAVRQALGESEGDLLAFLPGAGEIRRCANRLADLSMVDICPLYGGLPFSEQERAILPGSRRKVVLATNIAETSLTIEGIRVVVDAGYERRPRFDAARGITTLELQRISRASATQRRGRAGRLAPGRCYRLWSEGEHGALLPQTPAEIRNADLAPLALDLAHWGIADPSALPWLDSPPAGHLAAARALLQLLGALDMGGRLTPTGEAMALLPTHPRFARLLVAARAQGEERLAAALVALLDAGGALPPTGVAAALRQLKQGEGGFAVQRALRYWREKLGIQGRENDFNLEDEAAARLLAVAFPDRIGRARSGDSARYLFSGGFGAQRSKGCDGSSEWLVALEVTGSAQGEGEIRSALPLSRDSVEELFGAACDWQREVVWDEAQERVIAREVRRLGALRLQGRPVKATPEDALPALLGLIRRKGLELLNWSEAARQWRARVQLLAASRPDWTTLDDATLLATLESWLAPALDKITTLAALRRLDPLPALQTLLDWSQQQELTRLAPERLTVPSGSAIRLDYTAVDGPVLACKLQELFGLAVTPCVGDGKSLLIHLLSPAGRPLAVTRDLRSFWDTVYPEVKKEMKGRYPKHPWPDDPWNAVATRHVKKWIR